MIGSFQKKIFFFKVNSSVTHYILIFFKGIKNVRFPLQVFALRYSYLKAKHTIVYAGVYTHNTH